MFTGLIESMGTLTAVESRGEGRAIAFAKDDIPDIASGDSLCVSGVCLTAEESDSGLMFAISPETLLRTRFREIEPGNQLNLERSLPANGRLGGHFVTGHVDGVGHLDDLVPQGDFVLATFSIPKSLAPFLVDKGSICVEGVSLTLVTPSGGQFSCALVPETLERTTLGLMKPGSSINVEVDILAKHVHAFLEHRQA